MARQRKIAFGERTAMQAIIAKFGSEAGLVAQYPHWLVMIRPEAVTLGSLVIAATADATALGDLPGAAFAELAQVTRAIEAVLGQAVAYERINYLMLMMIEPHVHFHALPRYAGLRSHDGIAIADTRWPGPPDLATAVTLTTDQIAAQRDWLRALWPH